MAGEAKEKGMLSILRKEKVYVKPNLRNAGWIKSPKHRAHFMMEGSSKIYMAPLLRNGGIKNVLTDEEKDVLEDALQMDKNDLSVYKKPEDNFWASFKVRVTKETLELNLEDPYDYIKYKILLANTDFIAPSIKDIKNKVTYKFYIERPEEVNQMKAEQLDATTKAWELYGRFTGDKGKMLDFLRVYGEIVASSRSKTHALDKKSNIDLIKGTLAEIVSSNLKAFVNIVEDKNYDTKLFISKAVEQGLLERKNSSYHDKGESKPFAVSFVKAVEYLDNPENQDYRQLLETQLK